MSEPLIRASFFTGFDAFASMKGFDFDRLLAAQGMDRSMLSDPDNEIPLNAAATILNDAAAECADPCLGLHWAEALKFGSGGVLAYLVQNARSMRVAVRVIARYVHLNISPIDISYTESDGQGHLTWRFPPTFTAPRIQYASWGMAIFVIRLRRHAGANWYPVAIDLEHRELECRDEVLRVLGPNVRYDCGVNTLHVREEVLNRTTGDTDQRLFGLIKELGDRLLKERPPASDIVEKTKRAIVVRLEEGEATLEDVALDLELPVRTLQYRLSAAGSRFEILLQETRRDMAEIYMRDSDLSLTEIALMLGFSELSAFTRAAGKWFGVTPRERRAELRRARTN